MCSLEYYIPMQSLKCNLIKLTIIHEMYQFIDIRTSAQIMLIVCDKVTLYRPLFYVLELLKVDKPCKVTANSADWRFNLTVNATVSFHCVDVVRTVFTVFTVRKDTYHFHTWMYKMEKSFRPVWTMVLSIFIIQALSCLLMVTRKVT